MPTGLQIWDAAGVLVFDTGVRTFRKVDSLPYSYTNGSAVFNREPEDTSFVAVPRGWNSPSFTFTADTSTVLWDFGSVPADYRQAGVVEIWAT